MTMKYVMVKKGTPLSLKSPWYTQCDSYKEALGIAEDERIGAFIDGKEEPEFDLYERISLDRGVVARTVHRFLDWLDKKAELG